MISDILDDGCLLFCVDICRIAMDDDSVVVHVGEEWKQHTSKG